MLERIKHMLIKEFIQIFRDPRMRTVIFVVPIVQVLLFGYAVTTDVTNVRTGILDLDNSVRSRDLTARFVNSRYFNAVAYLDNEHEIERLINDGTCQVVLRFDHGFDGALKAGRTAPFQVILDGSDSNTAGIVLGYASKIVGAYSNEVLERRLVRMGAATIEKPEIVLETRAWFNDNLESRNFYVPGVIAMLIMLITLMLTGMAVVREKEVGTMEQIMVTPIRPFEFILGKTAPFALIGLFDVVLIAAVAVFWFGVPIRGNFLLLFFATMLYLMTTLGIGLFISTVSRTQQQAMMTTFFFYLPAILLSGFMFPIHNMPTVIQWVTYANPLRYFLVIIRGVFLKGVGADILWPQLLGLFVIGIFVLSFAVSRFKKTAA